jgi:hypothetical protein
VDLTLYNLYGVNALFSFSAVGTYAQGTYWRTTQKNTAVRMLWQWTKRTLCSISILDVIVQYASTTHMPGMMCILSVIIEVRMSLIALVTTVHPIAYYYKAFLQSTQFLLWLEPVQASACAIPPPATLFTHAHYGYVGSHCTTIYSSAILLLAKGLRRLLLL